MERKGWVSKLQKYGSCEEGAERGMWGGSLEEVNLCIEGKGYKVECIYWEQDCQRVGAEVEEIVRKHPKLSGYILEISLQVTLVQKSKSG